MTPVIRIDDEVMGALRSRAVEWGLVFSTPNQALRRLFGLDDREQQEGAVTPNPATTRSIETEVERRPLRVRGGRLLRAHPHLLGKGLKPYADREGGFYEWPKEFPAIFLDRKGYYIFETEESMLRASQYLDAYPETRKVRIPDGLSTLPGYVTCPPDCPHRRMYRSSP